MDSAPGQKIRVLTMVETIGLAGGGERLARDIAAGLDPDRFERILCSTRTNALWLERGLGEVIEELEADGIEVIQLERHGRADLQSWIPLIQRLRSGVDVLHAHMFGSNVWAALLGTLASTPVIVAHEHTWSFEGKPLRKFLDRELIARKSDAFIAVSREDRRKMIEVEGIDPADVIFIPNGIATPQVSSGVELRTELGIDDEAWVIGSVGYMRPQKRYDVLIRAAAKLRDRGREDFRVVIVGDGVEEDALRGLVDQLGLDRFVCFLGQREDIPNVLGLFDLTVNSSDFEGSPLSIMEYMAAELPVVATRVGGNPDLITDGEGGYIVEPGSPEQLVAAIERVISDPEGARRMGAENHRRRELEFDISTTVSRFEQLYEELMARSA